MNTHIPIRLHTAKHYNIGALWKHVSIIEVALHQLFLEFGKNLLSLSLPFYLIKTLGYTLPEVLIFYFFWQVPHSLVGPGIQSIIKSFGLKHSIALRGWTNAFYWLLLPIGLQGNLWMDITMLLPLFFIRATGNVTSEVAYDVFIINHAQKNHSGRTVALIRSMALMATILAPIIGGFVTFTFGLQAGALLSTFAFLAAGIVMLVGKDEQINVPYSAKEINKNMQSIPFHLVLGQIGIIAPSLAMWIFWPAFLAFILPNIATLGVFSAASTLIATILAFKIGSTLDKHTANAHTLLQRSGLRNLACSIVRFVWLEPIGLAIIDALYKINSESLYIPYAQSLLDWQRQDSLRRSHLRWLCVEHIYTIMIALCAVVLHLVQFHSSTFYIIIFVVSGVISLLTAEITKLALATD